MGGGEREREQVGGCFLRGEERERKKVRFFSFFSQKNSKTEKGKSKPPVNGGEKKRGKKDSRDFSCNFSLLLPPCSSAK